MFVATLISAPFLYAAADVSTTRTESGEASVTGLDIFHRVHNLAVEVDLKVDMGTG